MTRLVASTFATAIAVLALGGSAIAAMQSERAEASALLSPVSEPIAPTFDEGKCRIQYDALPAESQPMQMECEHAEWLAQRWGGRVLERRADGIVERASYEGDNDFTNVPASALPRAGYCRAWLSDVAVDAQPQESDCRWARRLADTLNGRVIYMPL